MENLPVVRLGLVAVSRDCFPRELSEKRRTLVTEACRKKGLPVEEIGRIVENEADAEAVLREIRDRGINGLVLYLGNFGPEGPTTQLAQRYGGPVMFAAAAEESGDNLIQGRGDAYCGMLSVSYNAALRRLKPFIPRSPVGIPERIAGMIEEFVPVARVLIGVRGLKIFAFGPRPQDFYTCHAPIQPLMDLGVEVMENSELDLLQLYNSVKSDPLVKKTAGEMAADLGSGNTYPDLLSKLAQYEIALLRFLEANLGSRSYGVFANKCWPGFEPAFGFVPCYVHARLASRFIPVACEVDIYGVLSEYMAVCATGAPPTILDINNTVPEDMYRKAGKAVQDYRPDDLFMGFHCGNTPGSCLADRALKHQLIMHRLMEPGKDPDITRGTLEGRIRSGAVTLFRLQATPDTMLRAYAAEGEVLNLDPRSFGGIGVFAVPEMGRFYRHVLLEKAFPHHTAVAFGHAGRVLFDAARMLGVEDLGWNRSADDRYPTENPFL